MRLQERLKAEVKATDSRYKASAAGIAQYIGGIRCPENSEYSDMLEKAKGMLELSLDGLKELALGGTAVGTGLNAPKTFGAGRFDIG